MTRNPLSILHNTIPSLRLVLFYSPSDNDTKNFKEKYIKLAASLRASGIKTGAVNCDKEPDLCDQHNANHLTGEARTRASTSVNAVVLSSRLIVTDGLRCSSRFSCVARQLTPFYSMYTFFYFISLLLSISNSLPFPFPFPYRTCSEKRWFIACPSSLLLNEQRTV
jgi:hypothetical protein